MKKLWMRIGVDVEVNDEAFKKLQSKNTPKEEIEGILIDMISNATLCGETYAPSLDRDLGYDYDNPEDELTYYFEGGRLLVWNV